MYSDDCKFSWKILLVEFVKLTVPLYIVTHFPRRLQRALKKIKT